MEIIQIGSIAILLKWLLLGLAVLFGLLFIKIWLQCFQKEEKQFELLSNVLFIGFLIWKGSLFLFEPTLLWKSPFSVLYFTGGSNGLALAIFFSMIYFIFKGRRKNISNLVIFQNAFVFSFVVLCFYHALSFIFRGSNHMLHFILGSVSLLIIILSLTKRNRLTAKWIFSSVIVFSFINLLVSFIFIETQNRLFIFTGEQWFYVVLIIFSLIYWDRKLIS